MKRFRDIVYSELFLSYILINHLYRARNQSAGFLSALCSCFQNHSRIPQRRRAPSVVHHPSDGDSYLLVQLILQKPGKFHQSGPGRLKSQSTAA